MTLTSPDTTEIGLPITELDTPSLLVDLHDLQFNIDKLAHHFAMASKHLRPHSKSHKTPAIAKMQMKAGAIGITCAKVGEAEVMANAGIEDLLIANEVVGRRKVERLMALAKRSDVMVAVDNPVNLAQLNETAGAAGVQPRVLVEVNIGHNRCGVLSTSEAVLDLCRFADTAEHLRFAGLMGYQGHIVDLEDASERESGAHECLQRLASARKMAEGAGLEVGIVSTSATGDYYVSTTYDAVTEVQAGSYALMDAAYAKLNLGFKNALTVLTTVSSRPDPNQVITDSGLKTVTPEHGWPLVKVPEGAKSANDPKGLRFLVCHALSEEHGRLHTEGGETTLELGDTIELIPGHGCTTMNLHDEIYAVNDGHVVDIWPISARGKVQ
ncbi:MAG: DSD1 family PLP-dependent enzyme [Candidatus Latescibacterota bacterium]|nr:DSD1 family PLP-dependent enzyme [Candidatus Latescibacterota bacterium]